MVATNLSEAELMRYQIDKRKMFKTTIAISIAYGLVALVLFLIAMLDVNGASKLSTDFLPFTATVVGGMFFVLILLIFNIVTFKAEVVKPPIVDDLKCPDFWKLQLTDKNSDVDYKGASAGVQNMMRYQCVPDSTIFGDSAFGTIVSPSGTTPAVYGVAVTRNTNKVNHPKSKLVDIASAIYTAPTTGETVTTSNIRCDKMYPTFMANKDMEFYPDNPNALRCQYATECKIPWSSVCPSRS
jgi:hypothetical protein